jgi:hypothetical protein
MASPAIKKCFRRSYGSNSETSLRECDYEYASSRARLTTPAGQEQHKYDLSVRLSVIKSPRRNRDPHALLRLQAERLRPEFIALAEQWRRDTKHLSLISQKVAHRAYLRIIGMGEPAAILLLEELRDTPAHWFAALRATTNIDPSPDEATPSESRDAWLKWGRSHGYID